MKVSAADVKAARESRGWSQNQLADHIGCTQATISRIESGATFSNLIARAVERLLLDEPQVRT